MAAARKEPGRLRIPSRTGFLHTVLRARVGRAQPAAVEEAATLLRELGHQAVTRDFDYPMSGVYGQALPRSSAADDDVKALPHP